MKTLIRSIYNEITKKAFLWTLAASLPIIYFYIIEYYGKDLNITNEQIILTHFGNNINKIVIIIALIAILFKAYADKYDFIIKQNGMNIVKKILDKSNESRIVKINYYSEFIQDDKQKSICKHMGPIQQLKKVIEQVNTTVSEIIGLDINDVYVIVLYKLPNENFFSTISTQNANNIHNNGYKTDDLILSEIKNGKTQFIELNKDKLKKGWYETNDILSVYCGNITSYLDKIGILEAYSIVATTTYPICTEKDRDTKDKFKSLIMRVFDLQFKAELLKYYICKTDKCKKRQHAA